MKVKEFREEASKAKEPMVKPVKMSFREGARKAAEGPRRREGAAHHPRGA